MLVRMLCCPSIPLRILPFSLNAIPLPKTVVRSRGIFLVSSAAITTIVSNDRLDSIDDIRGLWYMVAGQCLLGAWADGDRKDVV